MADKGRVYWDDEEKRKLIDTVFVMRQNDPDSSLISIINRAQSQLPSDRQRTIPSVKSIPWLSEAIKERFKAQREKVRALENVKAEAKSAKQTQADLKDKLSRLVEDARIGAIRKTSTEDLIIEIMARFEASRKELVSRIEKLEYENSADGMLRRTVPKKKLPVVLVIGMLGEQANNLKKRFEDKAELRCFVGDDVNKHWPYANHVIFNSKFASHKIYDRLKSEFAGKIHLVNGGQSAMAAKIEELLCSVCFNS